MQEEDIDKVAERIAGGIPRSEFSASAVRLFRSHLRRLGDEIGEPILPDEKDAPAYFVRVPLSLQGIGDVVVAMSPEAAGKILVRA